MSLVTISSLVPLQPLPSTTAFKALVTLLWPFSSATGQCALLLADPDFRKRYQKGQVRVRFAGPCAKAIGSSKVSIGDEIEIHLSGARWTSEDTDGPLVKTPGNGLSGELIFERSLNLVIRRDGQEDQVVLADEATASRELAEASDVPSTPAPRPLRRSLLGTDDFGVAVYSSPAFMKRLRMSEVSPFESPYTPVSEDDDLDTEVSRKRRRVSYKNVSEWKFVTKEPSPERQDDEQVEDVAALEGDVAERAGNKNKDKTPETASVDQEDVTHGEEDSAMKDATPVKEPQSQEAQAAGHPTTITAKFVEESAEGSSLPGMTGQEHVQKQTHVDTKEEDARAIVPTIGVDAEPPEASTIQADSDTEVPEPDNTQASVLHTAEEDAPFPRNLESQDDERDQGAEAGLPNSLSMPPPAPPRLEIPMPPPQFPTVAANLTERDDSQDPQTPRLKPVASQNLPLPSPFPTSATRLVAFTDAEVLAAEASNTGTSSHTAVSADVPVKAAEVADEDTGEDHTSHASEDMEVVELQDSDDKDNEDVQIIKGVPEMTMSPSSEAQRLANDAISVASSGEEGSIARSRATSEELPSSLIDGEPQVNAAIVERPDNNVNASGPTITDTFDPMELVHSSPVNEVEEPENIAIQDEPNQGVETTILDSQVPEQARSPSQGSEADVSSEGDYDEEVLAGLQLGSEGSEEGEEPDFDMLTDEFKARHNIDEQDLREMLGEESSSEDELVHDSDPEDGDSEDVEELIGERSDDDTGNEDENDSQGEDIESAVLPETWGKEEYQPSGAESDAESFASQVTPAMDIRYDRQPFGLDGSGGLDVAVVEVAQPTVPVEDDLEAAWRARDEALHALGDRQPPAPFHAALKLAETDTVKEDQTANVSQPSSKSRLAVVELLSDSEEEGDDDYGEKADASDGSGQGDAGVDTLDEGLRENKSSGSPEQPTSEEDLHPSASDNKSEASQDSGSPITKDHAQSEKGQIDVVAAEDGENAALPEPAAELSEAIFSGIPDPMSIGSNRRRSASQEEDEIMHSISPHMVRDDESQFPGRTPSEVGSAQRSSPPPMDVEEEASIDALHKQELLDGDQEPSELASLPAGLPAAGEESSVEVRSQALDAPQPASMDIVAPVSAPASESALQDIEDAQQLTSSSFMTLSSSSPAHRRASPSITQIEEVDLSQIEPDFGTQRSGRTGTQRTEPVPESVGTPVSTIYHGSSRQSSRVPTPSYGETMITSAGGATQDPVLDFSQNFAASSTRTLADDAMDTSLYDLRSQDPDQGQPAVSPKEDAPSEDVEMYAQTRHEPGKQETTVDDDLLAEYERVFPEPNAKSGQQSEILAEEVLSVADKTDNGESVEADEIMLDASSPEIQESGAERQATDNKDDNAVPSLQGPESPRQMVIEPNVKGDELPAVETLLSKTLDQQQLRTNDQVVVQKASLIEPTRVSAPQVLSGEKADSESIIPDQQAGQVDPTLLPQVLDRQNSDAARLSESNAVASPSRPSEATTSLKEQVAAQPQPHLLETPASKQNISRPRTSITARMSGVPSIISAWFTPRRSSGLFTPTKDTSAAQAAAKVPATAPPKLRQEASRERYISPPPMGRLVSQGTSTSLAYFHPLTALEEYLNQPSASVDIIAVSAAASTPPTKAKMGPRDFFTVLYISDPALQQKNDQSAIEEEKGQDMRVEIYRPWKASLPSTDAGDVVMLRNFVVKSRKHRTYLLSSESSSWCVWRFSANASQEFEGDAGDIFKPTWAKKRRASVKEEIRGPPMDIGVEERQKASELRKWWEELHVSENEEPAENTGLDQASGTTKDKEPELDVVDEEVAGNANEEPSVDGQDDQDEEMTG